MTTNEHIYDVVIVGAGPVGLATAIGLYKRGITNILVIDRTRAFRRVGQGIDLLPNGLKALKYIDLNAYEAVKEAAKLKPKSTNKANQPKWESRNFKGEKISSSSTSLEYDDWYSIYGEGRFSVSWYDLQTTLREQLPPSLVVSNHRCVNLVEESNYLRIDCLCDAKIEANPYAHWQEKDFEDNNQSVEPIKQSLKGKLVIGADGINSKIRQIIYQNTSYSALGKPEYSGFAAIFCNGIQLSEKIAQQLEKTFLQNNPIVSISDNTVSNIDGGKNNPRIILFNRNGVFGYLIHLPLHLQELTKKLGQNLINLALKKLKSANFPENIQELVNKSDKEQIGFRLYYINRASLYDSISFPNTANLIAKKGNHEFDSPWVKERIVLVGDAAHGMPPFSAQGANQGLEDAAVIITLINNLSQNNNWDDTKAITEAFLKYEKIRRPMMIKIQEATLYPFSYLSEDAKSKYNQEIYSRDLKNIICSLIQEK